MTEDTYFAQTVPQQYASAMAAVSDDVASQPLLTITYVIDGVRHGLRAEGRELIYVAGGIDASDLTVSMSGAALQQAIAHGSNEMFIDFVQRRKVAVVKGIRGNVALDMTQADGAAFEAAMLFNGAVEPAVTLRMTMADFQDTMSGKLNANTAFMLGKLKFDGSLPLLMQIGALGA